MFFRYRAGAPFHWCLIFAVFGAIFLTPACGKKAPPLPPAHFDMPAVEDLASELEGDRLTLTWPMPDWDPPEGIELAGFNVYRAKIRQEDVCYHCPIHFEKVEDVAVDDLSALLKSDVNYREELETGYKYHYKVAPYTSGGREGGDSPIVTINH